MASANMELLNVRLPLEDERRLYRLTVNNGRWVSIQPQTEYLRLPDSISLEDWRGEQPREPLSDDRIDVEGKMLLPGLVDSHMHLDKAFSLTSVENVSGTLEEACFNYELASSTFTKSEIKSRIMRSALQALSFGTTSIRTHLDFHTKSNVRIAMNTVEAALEVKEALAPYMTLQLIPMIPSQLSPSDIEMVEEAIRLGVDGLGGAPHLSQNPKEHIEFIFKMAGKHNTLIDLHADETDNPNMRTVEQIAMLTKEYGMQGRVTVDHLCSLASMPDSDAERVIRSILDSGLKVVSLPAVNLYLQGRFDSFPVRRGVTRLKEMWDAGIPIAVASDNIHDPFHPFGRGDLVQIGLISSYAAHMGRPADLRTLIRMISNVPASILGIPEYGVKTGCHANFVILDCSTPAELFTMLPERRWVYSGGKWVRMASKKAEWSDAALSNHWDQASEVVRFGQ